MKINPENKLMCVSSAMPDRTDEDSNRAGAENSPDQLVDFVIIGAMRAGTTTMHTLLSRHDQISMSRDKETDYFIAQKNYGRGIGWYRAQFDVRRPIRGEASPNYSKARDFPGVPARLVEHAPAVRIIYVVRDPVARAVSQYEHSWNMGRPLPRPEVLAGSDEYLSLIDISSYARQLDHWRKHVGDDQILIVDFDLLVAQPQSQIDRILAHVGAAPMPLGEAGAHNSAVQLSRVPRPLLRLAQGRLRPVLTRLLNQRLRDRLRRLSAIGPRRRAPEFPDHLLSRMRQDLASDAARFRQMTGMEFAHWTV